MSGQALIICTLAGLTGIDPDRVSFRPIIETYANGEAKTFGDWQKIGAMSRGLQRDVFDLESKYQRYSGYELRQNKGTQRLVIPGLRVFILNNGDCDIYPTHFVNG